VAECVDVTGRQQPKQKEIPMPRVALPEGVSVNCSVDDFL
jgi:hypothetical protein